MNKKIMTVEDQQNAVTLEIVGAQVVLTSRHKWENTRRFVSVAIDRDVARLLAKAIWRCCNKCNDEAERIGVTYHEKDFAPSDDPEADTVLGKNPPDWLLDHDC